MEFDQLRSLCLTPPAPAGETVQKGARTCRDIYDTGFPERAAMSIMHHHLTILFLTLALSACASNSHDQLADAFTSPLHDLNLIRVEIPSVLLKAQKQPYAVTPETPCMDLFAEVRELDAVLGPDLDAPATAAPGLIEQGAGEVENVAVGAVRGTAESIVPFRGWVRRLTGAERHSRNVAAAIVAGTVRRAFIKGLMNARSCA